MTFQFRPDVTTGQVHVTTDPVLAAYPIIVPPLRNGDCGNWRSDLRATINDMAARFDGGYAASCGVKFWHVHPYQLTHIQYFNLAFRRIWADLGGTLKGQARTGPLPGSARLLVEWESAPLSAVIRDINKYSNNVMARQLLLTMAYQTLQLPANTEHGGAVVRTWLAAKGIDAPELFIENGSGLSRDERISALTMGRMLVSAFHSPVMPELMASLPLVGRDGTMRNRMNGHAIAGNAHIKTGYLDEVRSIAGYVLAASGKRYAVVCMINHPNAIEGKETQDALLQWVYERG
jgi:D-alanyl-D-alanine carboxypeptidase/D-alanyl-D-alanine-endopeptidase (penicillin-binding protein 4)